MTELHVLTTANNNNNFIIKQQNTLNIHTA